MYDESHHGSLDDWDWERIPARVDAVLLNWSTTVRGASPWRNMHADDACGGIRSVVNELLNEGRHPSDGAHRRRLAAAARAHGSFRRGQQCDHTTVTTEIDALLSAFRSALVDAGLPPTLVRDCLLLLEADVEFARDFALVGWLDADGANALNA